MSSTISKAQGAFLAGRHILDQVLIANEAIEDIRLKNKEGVILKLDSEKAYGHVDRDFLDKVMMKKGFGWQWRMWMWGCVRNVQYCIMVNGSFILATRGLRQGDPPSPFLFLLVDVLGRLINN